jgi:hypothetical protein
MVMSEHDIFTQHVWAPESVGKHFEREDKGILGASNQLQSV